MSLTQRTHQRNSRWTVPLRTSHEFGLSLWGEAPDFTHHNMHVLQPAFFFPQILLRGWLLSSQVCFTIEVSLFFNCLKLNDFFMHLLIPGLFPLFCSYLQALLSALKFQTLDLSSNPLFQFDCESFKYLLSSNLFTQLFFSPCCTRW